MRRERLDVEQNERTANNKKHLIALAVYASVFLFFLVITNLEPFNRFLSGIFRVLRPVVIGLVLAYLLNPFFRFFERKPFYKIRPNGLRRTVSLIFTYLVLAAVFVALIFLIVPQLADSILNFVNDSDEYLEKVLTAVNGLIEKLNATLPENSDGMGLIPPIEPDAISNSINGLLGSFKIDSAFIMNLLTSENVGSAIAIFGDILALAGDILFGLFISLYLLASKEKRYAQVMRWRKAFLGKKTNAYITKICSTADRSFGGFLRGKILDSCIVGILVFISISLLKVPYAVLIAVIVGVTDIVPVIGPFIGVIPSALIILLTDPAKVIPFVLCILVIQQIDGNIIAPKMLGENTGVSSLCVIISITTLGALWGLVGMILGVPIFATVLELTGEFLDERLRRKGLSTATEDYYTSSLSGEANTGAGSMIAKDPRRSKKEARSPTVPREGKGVLSDTERFATAIYDLAKHHGVLNEGYSEDQLAAFAEDVAALQAVTPQKELPAPTEETFEEAADAPVEAEAGLEADANVQAEKLK